MNTPNSCNNAPVENVCDYGGDLLPQPNTDYSIAVKSVVLAEGCPPETSCEGEVVPLKEFRDNFVYEKFAPTRCVTHVEHGFVMGAHPIPVYQDQANANRWVAAQDGVNAAEGVICEVTSENTYEVLVTPGFIKGDHGLDTGSIYYLSATNPGEVTTTG